MFRKVLLTFDVEDFINERSIKALNKILRLLEGFDFRALFFITGHMAEKLSNFPEILGLLAAHEIGYHSSSHSVRPTIFEYTDVKNYEEAYLTSIKRETAHVNPLTGEVGGKGGIECLRALFPNKEIVSFRAPGSCWSPPHLEGLAKLGINFDFSASISHRPVYFKGITFYPFPIGIDRFDRDRLIAFSYSILKNRITVLASHPSSFVNRNGWDRIYHKGKPEKLFTVPPKTYQEMDSRFLKFEWLLKWIKVLERIGFIEVLPYLRRSRINLAITKMAVRRCYETSMIWPRLFFDYSPKFLRFHFFNYFDVSQVESEKRNIRSRMDHEDPKY